MARPIVRASLGTVLAKRVNVFGFTVPDVTSTDFDNPVGFDLLACAETIDEEIESTGGTTANTDVAVAPLYSKIVGLKLRMFVKGGGGEFLRWAILKNPDNDITNAVANSNWHVSDDSTAAREVRANQLSKGLLLLSNDKLSGQASVFVRRKTLARLGALKENDRLKFTVSKDSTASTCSLTMWGTIYVKANA